jgi:hypothetical protein
MVGKQILVTWETQDEVVPDAETIDHFGIKLKDTAGEIIQDVSAALDKRSHMFIGVEPGDYMVEAQSYNSDESVSSAAPMTAPVTVESEAAAPVVVNLTATSTPAGPVLTPLGR